MSEMKNKIHKFDELLVVEELTVPVVLRHLLPFVARHPQRDGLFPIVYFIDADAAGQALGRAVCRCFGLECQKLEFKLADIFDEQNRLLRLRLSYDDMFDIQDAVMRDPVMRTVFDQPAVRNNPSLAVYLRKQATSTFWFEKDTLHRLLQLVHIAHWQAGRLGCPAARKTLFAFERRFGNAFDEYVRPYNTRIVTTGNHVPGISGKLCETFSEHRLRAWSYAFRSGGIPALARSLTGTSTSARQVPGGPKLWTESYGQWNIDEPQYFSDLFFWQESELAAEDILVTFNLPIDPLDERKRDDLRRHGMNAAVLNPRASRVDEPYFDEVPVVSEQPFQVPADAGALRGWLSRQSRDYALEKDYWIRFFKRHNVKLTTSWHRVGPRHCVITDALHAVGGISTLYQRSWAEFRLTETAASADVSFGYAHVGAEHDRLSHSVIPYHVVTGYLGDHRFSKLKPAARKLRKELLATGAKYVIAYLDENSGNDSRWHTGHEIMRVNFEYILRKLLTTPEMALVIKPKVPTTLRRRLGSVASLLDEAEATGRFRLIQGGALHSNIPPALAALASDVAIHGCMCAVTAGLECALTGVPTLVFDTEGWPDSPLYGLGVGRCVFRDWDHLWTTWQDHRAHSGGVPGFGDWSPLINQYDPFRDGRAAWRMGTYLKELMIGLKVGRPRADILADAAQRYACQWGADKIIAVNTRARVPRTAREDERLSTVHG